MSGILDEAAIKQIENLMFSASIETQAMSIALRIKLFPGLYRNQDYTWPTHRIDVLETLPLRWKNRATLPKSLSSELHLESVPESA